MMVSSERDLNDCTLDALMDAARAAAQRAYAPYSAFSVGAAVLTDDGTIVCGCNVENASYGLTVCAERVAVFTAVAAGHVSLKAVAVSAPKAVGVTPCGACRQVLREFVPQDGDLLVILDQPDRREVVRLSELLPRSFGPASLAEGTA